MYIQISFDWFIYFPDIPEVSNMALRFYILRGSMSRVPKYVIYVCIKKYLKCPLKKVFFFISVAGSLPPAIIELNFLLENLYLFHQLCNAMRSTHIVSLKFKISIPTPMLSLFPSPTPGYSPFRRL